MCEAGPSSGEGSGLATVVVLATVVAAGGVAVGGGRGGADAVVVELNGVAVVLSCTFGGACWWPPAVVDEQASALIVRSAAPRIAEMAAAWTSRGFVASLSAVAGAGAPRRGGVKRGGVAGVEEGSGGRKEVVP